jgi:hypothetical protein
METSGIVSTNNTQHVGRGPVMRFQCLDHVLFVHSALGSSKAAVERLWPLPRGDEGGGCVDDG